MHSSDRLNAAVRMKTPPPLSPLKMPNRNLSTLDPSLQGLLTVGTYALLNQQWGKTTSKLERLPRLRKYCWDNWAQLHSPHGSQRGNLKVVRSQHQPIKNKIGKNPTYAKTRGGILGRDVTLWENYHGQVAFWCWCPGNTQTHKVLHINSTNIAFTAYRLKPTQLRTQYLVWTNTQLVMAGLWRKQCVII